MRPGSARGVLFGSANFLPGATEGSRRPHSSVSMRSCLCAERSSAAGSVGEVVRSLRAAELGCELSAVVFFFWFLVSGFWFLVSDYQINLIFPKFDMIMPHFTLLIPNICI